MNNGLSPSESAQRDLDAALQLLAHRAQYITGASGAAIALRRDGKRDMLCRASIGTNAPELGALLSAEVGLSGESVRTRRLLRCDDTLSDTRVNREICQQLGIGSVVVMPVVNDDQVLGVFELFSAKANAFGERDLSVVQRLAEMVQTAVQLARAAEALPRQEKARAAAAAGNRAVHGEFVADLVTDELAERDPFSRIENLASDPQAANQVAIKEEADSPALLSVTSAPAKKPLLWSAPVSAETDTSISSEVDQSHVPPVLRDLRKCVACGFPVSAGRMLCVECEEKKWKGQLRSRPSQRVSAVSSVMSSGGAAAAPTMAKIPVATTVNSVTPASSPEVAIPLAPATKVEGSAVRESQSLSDGEVGAKTKASAAGISDAPEFVLTAAVGPSQSWLSSHKYVLIAIAVIVSAAVAVLVLR